jgi:hypothetical protein
MLQLRAAQAADIEAMCDLLLEHGPNPWNYLPEVEVRGHLAAIASARHTPGWLRRAASCRALSVTG